MDYRKSNSAVMVERLAMEERLQFYWIMVASSMGAMALTCLLSLRKTQETDYSHLTQTIGTFGDIWPLLTLQQL